MSLFVRDDDEEEVLLTLNGHSDGQDEAPVGAPAGAAEEQEEYPLIAEEEEELLDQIEPVDISLTLPLRFQQLILEDLIADDSLLILGKGLGLEPIVANLLHVLSAPATVANVKKRSLVILLNASDEYNEKISDELTELSWIEEGTEDEEDNKRPFVILTSETSTPEKRRSLYTNGGIFSVTSRIFYVDLLSGIVDPNLITGLVILRAEKITDVSTEAFIARKYKQHNKWGFIKALSDSPESFATGYDPLHKKLKDLRLKKVLLWPRFHIDVSKSLVNKDTKSVTEVKVMMTDSMRHIQTGLMACLKSCVDEIRRTNPDLPTEYWTIENALDPRFVQALHAVLDPQSHRISYKTKQLLKDIRLLKDLLRSLISYDAVDFYETIQLVIESQRSAIDKTATESPWLMVEEAQAVLTYGKKRVYDNNEYVLEEAPKWEQLAILLEDITVERAHDPSRTGPVLIMCSNGKVKARINRFLKTMKEVSGENRSYSARKMMVNKLEWYLDQKEMKDQLTSSIKQANTEVNEDESLEVSKAFAKGPVMTKRRRTRGGAAVAAVTRLHADPSVAGDIESKMNKLDLEMEAFELGENDDDDEEVIIIEDVEEGAPDASLFEDISHLEDSGDPSEFYEYIDRENQVIVQMYSDQTDDIMLQELMPSFIIMYEPNLSFIRRLEVYQSVHKESPARAFFMYYSDSVEEQFHLTAIRKEKESFTKLIREKANLASHFEADEDFNKFHVRKSQVMNTRIAGGANFRDPTMESQVIVDSREFRASLPGLLDRIGLRVVPCVLTVGDYILTPKICVERKSIPDLIGSFKSGRLYEQCERMCHYYELPTLLIEFDSDKSFSLEPFAETRHRGASTKPLENFASTRMQEEIQKNIAGLVIHFPRMRILWSSSPFQTAELMMELKAAREEPNVLDAVNAGLSEDKKNDNVSLSDGIITALQHIPGINNVDYYTIMKKIKDVEQLKKMSKHQISLLVGQDLGERIYEYISSNY